MASADMKRRWLVCAYQVDYMFDVHAVVPGFAWDDAASNLRRWRWEDEGGCKQLDQMALPTLHDSIGCIVTMPGNPLVNQGDVLSNIDLQLKSR
jgi:hypothetical protein